jgi:hypothetical protein
MRFEFGIFDGDTLLERGEFEIASSLGCAHFDSFHAAHLLDGDAAKITLSSFSSRIRLKKVDLDVPLHESEDWESIDLAGYTLAFRCYLCA